LTKELHDREYNARIPHRPAAAPPAPPGKRRKTDARSTRRLAQEQEQKGRVGEPAAQWLADDEMPDVGLEDPSKRARGRPALREEVKSAAREWRQAIMPWVRLIYGVDKDTSLADPARRRRIRNGLAAAPTKPPVPKAFPLTGHGDPNQKTNLAFLIDSYIRARKDPRRDLERPVEWIADEIVRAAFSAEDTPGLYVEDEIPAQGAKPLRQLLRPTKR
jgi:hypothetical protein